MKKLIYVGVCVLFCSINSFAQKLTEGSITALKTEKEIDVVIDYTDISVNGLKEKDFLALHEGEKEDGMDWSEYWEKQIKKNLKFKLIGSFNQKLIEKTELRGGVFPEAKYQMIVHILSLNENGDIIAEISFNLYGSKTSIAKAKINVDGGMFGSFENLAGDGFQNTGEYLGKLVLKRAK